MPLRAVAKMKASDLHNQKQAQEINMQLSVKGKQVDIGEALRSHIEDHLPTAVEKYFDNSTDAHVIVSKESNDFTVDIQVHVGKRVMVQSSGKSNDAYGAFEESLEHCAKRLRRYKRRLKDHKGKGVDTLPAQQYVLQPELEDAQDEPEQPIIVAEMPTEIETLSVGEAVMRMDLASLPALLFRSSKHGGLNLVYQRQDGNIGWVDPQQAAEA